MSCSVILMISCFRAVGDSRPVTREPLPYSPGGGGPAQSTPRPLPLPLQEGPRGCPA